MRHLLLSAFFILSGCAALSTTGPTTDDSTQQQTAKKTKEYPTRPFETNTLYNLLVAEIAGQRSQYDVALTYYLDEARHTQDPNVAARASRIAQYLNEPQAAAEAADIWRDQDKQNIHAHMTAANNWLKQQQVKPAISALQDALAISDAISLEQIYLSGKSLPPEQHQPLIDGISSLLETYPNHVRLFFTKALLLSDYGRTDEALTTMKQLRQVGTFLPPHYIMEAKLYAQTGNDQASLATLKEGWEDFTGDKTIGLLYGQAMADSKKVDEALEILETLVETHPTDDEILISSGLIHAELGQYKEAQALFTSATETKQKDNAWYFIGQLHEQQGNYPEAIKAYGLVTNGKNLISSITRSTSIVNTTQDLTAARAHLRKLHSSHPAQTPRLIQIEAELVREDGQLEESVALYNEAIALEPTDANLFYGRAMVLDLNGDLQGMERDLKSVLDINPKSSAALNALGYTLADKTDRLEEARNYIEQAYIIKPNEPAIIDSLGWVYFKLGDFEKAEMLLMQAYNLFQDQEVAAHLGEVLWVQNKKDQALKIWIDGLKHDPRGVQLLETLKRYNIDVDHVDEENPNENSKTSNNADTPTTTAE